MTKINLKEIKELVDEYNSSVLYSSDRVGLLDNIKEHALSLAESFIKLTEENDRLKTENHKQKDLLSLHHQYSMDSYDYSDAYYMTYLYKETEKAISNEEVK